MAAPGRCRGAAARSDGSDRPAPRSDRRQGGIRQNALADAVGVEGPSLVRSLDQLCAAGLVTREADSTDRRAKRLYLTERGRALSARVVKELEAQRRSIFDRVSRHDLEASMRIFQHLAKVVSLPPDLPDDEGA